MGYFKNIKFELTADNSAGLFDEKVGDIFHSRTGALKEAQEKFINPILNLLSYFPDTINVLDICYGIGYNTKALFQNLGINNINVDALEYNQELIFLSPFIKDEIFNDDLKLFLINQILAFAEKKEDIASVLAAVTEPEYKEFISPFTMQYIDNINSNSYVTNPFDNKQLFLHNIYYKYISQSMKSYIKPAKYQDSSINFYSGDARKSIFLTKNMYDVIFLDAFSPQKDPTLWTIDFLAILKLKMKQNSILVSYSKSAPFRSALLELGFYVGKTIINNTDMGTVASFNSYLIQNKLTKDDINIIETRSGIPYRDINLSLNANEIIINRSIEGAASTRVSRTQFEKMFY